jgi:DNA-binding NarL/FixJ family response regulator
MVNVACVFIVEDHEAVRWVLRKFIQLSPDLSLCGEASSAEDALAQIPDSRPQLVLVDVSLPGMNGIELIRILHKKYPDMLLLVLSGHDESVYAIMALRAGARGYAMKGETEKLREAIRCVLNGDIYLSEKLQGLLDGSL